MIDPVPITHHLTIFLVPTCFDLSPQQQNPFAQILEHLQSAAEARRISFNTNKAKSNTRRRWTRGATANRKQAYA
jgi:hypothetical protein